MKRHDWGVVVCVASGPSLTPEQCAVAMEARARAHCRIIAVNNNYISVPSADILFAADGKWWRQHLAAVRASGFRGELWTQDHAASAALDLRWIHGKPGAGLSKEPETILHGGHSGHQAVGLAVLLGARRILLAGFDMTRGKHWHPDHQKPLSNGDMSVLVPHYEKMARDLEAAGVECVNCTGPNSAIPYFRRGELADELATVTA